MNCPIGGFCHSKMGWKEIEEGAWPKHPTHIAHRGPFYTTEASAN